MTPKFPKMNKRKETDTVFAPREDKGGPMGPYGYGFGSTLANPYIERVPNVSEGSIPYYNPDDIFSRGSAYSGGQTMQPSPVDTRLPTWEENEALQNMMRSQFAPRSIVEAMLYGTGTGKTYRPYDPRQEYDYLGMLRSQVPLSADPADSYRLHGDSRFKAPTHPTRFGVDEPNADIITDRITGRPMEWTPENIDILLRNLGRQFGD